ncbi:integrase [Vibrio parahaemolyticus]|nr:integrase [Vibrio parahaemolyticus]
MGVVAFLFRSFSGKLKIYPDYLVMKMALTDKTIRATSCPENKKSKKLFDGNGLYLLINKTGSKLWRMRYKYSNKHQELALGKYPQTTLSEARELSKDARKLLDQGINPMEQRKARKSANHVTNNKLFEVVAMNWWSTQQDDWTVEYGKKVKRWILNDCSSICEKSIDSIKVSDIAKIVLSLKESGTPKKAPPILSSLNRIFGFALGQELTETNPAQNFPLKDVIGKLPVVQHRAAITEPKALGRLISDIDNNETGEFCTVEALKLLPRVFLRPVEIRSLKWSYVCFEDELITLPASDMKKDRDHIVPLSSQVIKQLLKLKCHTGYSEYLFPNQRDASKPLSKNVLTNRLRELGYAADIVSAHGFRSTASTILNENEWDDQYIEMQLSHLIGTSSSRPYNRAKFLKQRKKMMQWWSDYLDSIKVT